MRNMTSYRIKLLINSMTNGTKNYQHNANCVKYLSSYNKSISNLPESTKQSITLPTTTPDYLLQNLKNARNTQGVFELVNAHCKIMNTKQLMQALRSLFSLQKYGNSNLSTQQIIQHPDFERLCHQLKTQAGMIELNETIEALKVVSYVGVSSKSTIVQVLLQLLRQNVNDLSLFQIIFLDFLLKQFKSSPLVDGLLIALPIVFEVNLPTKIDRQNPIHLAEYLHFVAKKNVSNQCIELIVNCLNQYLNGGGVVNVSTAKSILWSICDMEEDEFFEPLYTKMLYVVLDDIDKLDYINIDTTLSKMTNKNITKFPFYYNDVFVDTCANYVIDNNLEFEDAMHVLKKCSHFNHTHDKLLNYVCTKFHENPDLLLQTSAINISNLIVALGLSEFKPTYWSDIKEALGKIDCFKNYKKRDIPWLKIAAILCALDIYKFEVLEAALEKSNLDYMFRQLPTSGYENFFLINQAICTFEPNYKHLLPSKTVVENVIRKIKPVLEYPLEAYLQKGLGGDKYLKTCIKTELGHHIDHLVVLRRGGFPMPLSTNSQYLEEIEIPEDSHMILILALGPLHYTLNSKRLKTTSSLIIKTLEAKGYTVVTVCLEIWETMADFEKIPYLMQSIKTKLQNRISMSDTV